MVLVVSDYEIFYFDVINEMEGYSVLNYTHSTYLSRPYNSSITFFGIVPLYNMF